MVKTVDLRGVIAQFQDWSQTIGPAEIQLLQDVDLFLQIAIPHEQGEKFAYLSKSSRLQGQLNNLLSRLSYVFRMNSIERDAYWGELLESREYEGRDKRYIALSMNPKFRDVEETNASLEIIKDHVNNLMWILKTIAGRL